MYTTTFNLDLKDTRTNLYGIELFVNGKSIIVIGQRIIYIITTLPKEHFLPSNKMVATWIPIKDIYCATKMDKIRYDKKIPNANVLSIYYTDNPKRKNCKFWISMEHACQDIEKLLGHDLSHWYLVLKQWFIQDIIHHIFTFIID